jgi:hypothetical protein
MTTVDGSDRLKITSWSLVGNHLTRRETVERYISEIDDCTSISEVLMETASITQSLNALGVFQSVKFDFKPDPHSGETGKFSLEFAFEFFTIENELTI